MRKTLAYWLYCSSLLAFQPPGPDITAQKEAMKKLNKVVFNALATISYDQSAKPGRPKS